MKVNVIKAHHFYAPGVHDISEGRAKYLISIGVAEEVHAQKEKHEMHAQKEKHEIKKTKEKKEK